GVTGGVTHGSHAGVQECTGTGGGAAGVAARFKSDDGGAAPCAVARILQGGYFGMWASGPLVPPLADGAAVGIENDAAHGGVGADPAVPARAQGEGAAHRCRDRGVCLGHPVLLRWRAAPGPTTRRATGPGDSRIARFARTSSHPDF